MARSSRPDRGYDPRKHSEIATRYRYAQGFYEEHGFDNTVTLFRPVPTPQGGSVDCLPGWVDMTYHVHGPNPDEVHMRIPLARYYALRLTRAAIQQLRIAFRDLWAEGVLQPLYQQPKPAGKYLDPAYVGELIRLYCVEMLSHKQIQQVMQVKDAFFMSREIPAAFQFTLTYIEPKIIRDQLFLVALGRRAPIFTREEVKYLLGYGKE